MTAPTYAESLARVRALPQLADYYNADDADALRAVLERLDALEDLCEYIYENSEVLRNAALKIKVMADTATNLAKATP